MLLSQCLAISLSPSIKCQKLRADLSRESALELFEQFLAENQLGDGKLSSTSRNRHVEQPERSNTEPSAPETMVLIKQELGACKSNTCFELAGFVLPSWLLVSGSTHDLEYLRSRWLDSQLKAPAGFHLETVGNIRSVSIDYLELDSNQRRQKQLDAPTVLNAIDDLAKQGNKLAHIGQLIELLKSKIGRIESVGPLDRIINELVETRKVRLRPMEQQQVAQAFAEHRDSSLAARSVFLDQIIEPKEVGSSTLASSGKAAMGSDDTQVCIPVSSIERSLSLGSISRGKDNKKKDSCEPILRRVMPAFIRSKSVRVSGIVNRYTRDKRSQMSNNYATIALGHRRDPSRNRLSLFFRRIFSTRRHQQDVLTNTVESNSHVSSKLEQANLSSDVELEEPNSVLSRSHSYSSESSSILDTIRCSERQQTLSTFNEDHQLSNLSIIQQQLALDTSNQKSSASQELRNHLDEVYRRHLVCTNQRDKEFIDSINVLRQASRHAEQNSRSSSKNKHTKSTFNSEDTRSSSCSSYSSPPCSNGVCERLISCSTSDDLCEFPMSQASFTCVPSSCCLPGHSDELPVPDPRCPIWRSILEKYWLPHYGYMDGFNFEPVWQSNLKKPGKPAEASTLASVNLSIDIASKLIREKVVQSN